MKLEHIAFLGRTFSEYTDMFALTDEILTQGPVLDCPAGPSSFTAEAYAAGLNVTACDPVYENSSAEMKAKADADFTHVFDHLDDKSDLYVWNYYRDRDDIMGRRRTAMNHFLEDYTQGRAQGRYVTGGLPALPFEDDRFSLTLSGHFLFLYEDWIGLESHIQNLKELLRVTSGEVRVFPLLNLEGMEYEYLGYIINHFQDSGIQCEVDKVKLEFMRGGCEMLRLIKKPLSCQKPIA